MYGGTFNGNSCRILLKNIGELRRLCPIIEGLAYAAAFEAFNSVVESCFGYHLNHDFVKSINHFKDMYLNLEISVTPKLHAIFFMFQHFV